MDEIQLKYNLLDNQARKEVEDFLDFLLSKSDKLNSDLSEYKKKILKVSVWSKEDVSAIIEAQNKSNQWQPKEG